MGDTKIFFASDFHLGLDMPHQSCKQREKLIINWLDEISDEASELYLLGDVFDYWFEYRSGIPKGFETFLAKLKELRDLNIPIHLFTGNHDLWMKSYFQNEFGIPVNRTVITKTINGKIIHMGHGDGLGPGDLKYKFLKRIFTNPACQWAFSALPKETGLGLMKYFSKRSRESDHDDLKFLGADKEWLIQYALDHNAQHEIDYYLFGHRHLPIDYQLKNNSARYINLGEWLSFRSYAVLEKGDIQLKFYKNPDGRIYS